MQYWIDGISEAFDEIGIVATQAQIEFVADAVNGAHQVHGEAHGNTVTDPMREENERLKRELKSERGKTRCPDCKGTGGKVDGSVHPAWFECSTCRGEGRF